MTASTPFSRYPVTYQGEQPDDRPKWDTRRHRLWLGKPGNMIELPSPDPTNSTAPSPEASPSRASGRESRA